MPIAQVREVTLHYEPHRWEWDADVLALVNGFLMSTAGWANQVGPLSLWYRLLLHDCREMWWTEHPLGSYSLEVNADDLVGLLDHLEVERAHLVGISYGAEVSLTCALRHPDRVVSLAVPSVVARPGPILLAQIKAWIAAAEREELELLWSLVYAASFSRHWVEAHPGEREAGARRYAGLDFRAAVELFRAFLRFHVADGLGRVGVPTIILVGEEDILKAPAYAAALAWAIPGVQFMMVPGAGHDLCLERLGEFNTAILGFLAQHARGRA